MQKLLNMSLFSVFPIAYCLLPIAYCLLPIAYCLLPIAYCLLPIAYCILPIAYCLLPIADGLLPIAYIAYCLLLVACRYMAKGSSEPCLRLVHKWPARDRARVTSRPRRHPGLAKHNRQ